MPRTHATDRRWLERHGGKWRVSVAVPRRLHKVLGTRLKKPLHTDSLAVANALKLRVVAELRARIERAQEAAAGKPRAIIREAAEIAAHYRQATDPEEIVEIRNALLEREVEILGPGVGEHVNPETGHAVPLYDAERTALATKFRQVATGAVTPLALHHDAYLEQTHVSKRTKDDDVRAVRYLAMWCERNGVPPSLEAITPKVAVRFLDDLPELGGGLKPPTLKKYLNRLGLYWEYLLERYDIEMNPWRGRRVKAPPQPEGEEPRSFTDEEVRQLLIGGGPPKIMDLLRFGLLTGARIEVIVQLKVRDCADGGIRFKRAKREKRSRDVPIHPDLVEIIERRSGGRAPGDDLFPEWPPVRKEGSKRERSFAAVKAFTAYRRKCKVDEVVPGGGRSRVTFHSCRRWFITKAERTGTDKTLVAAIVGHKRGSITLDRYSAGPAWDDAKTCIEQVRLPPLDQGPIPEERSLNPNHARRTGEPFPPEAPGPGDV